jgi:hypothetical protein
MHTAYTHRTHTPHTHAPVHEHTRKHRHTHTNTHTHTRLHTNARAHDARQDKGSDTLAQVRGYVFNHNGSAIDTCAGKNTHARAHTAAKLAQVSRYVFKHLTAIEKQACRTSDGAFTPNAKGRHELCVHTKREGATRFRTR